MSKLQMDTNTFTGLFPGVVEFDLVGDDVKIIAIRSPKTGFDMNTKGNYSDEEISRIKEECKKVAK